MYFRGLGGWLFLEVFFVFYVGGVDCKDVRGVRKLERELLEENFFRLI